MSGVTATGQIPGMQQHARCPKLVGEQPGNNTSHSPLSCRSSMFLGGRAASMGMRNIHLIAADRLQLAPSPLAWPETGHNENRLFTGRLKPAGGSPGKMPGRCIVGMC